MIETRRFQQLADKPDRLIVKLFLFLAKRNDLAGAFARILALTAGLLMVFCISLTIAIQNSQTGACLMAFLLSVMCFGISHLVSEFPRGNDFAMVRLSLSIALRTGLLAGTLFLVSRDLLNQGFIHYILAFYSIGLGMDVGLTCLRIKHSPKPTTDFGSLRRS